MARVVGKKAKIKFNPDADGLNFNESEFPFANVNCISSNKKIKDLGFVFTSLEKGLTDDYLNYYQSRI